MTTGKALNGKPYAGNPYVRFDEGEVASVATPRRGSLLYKTITLKITVAVVMILAAGVVGAAQKPPTTKTSLSESELRTLAETVPDVKNAGQLYSIALATSNDVARQQEFLKASAACLLACGKGDTYQKYIKGKLTNAKAFEDSLKESCKQCGGVGKKDRRCYVCSGKGMCSFCKGSGRTVSMGFDRPNGTKPCHNCRGSGDCHKCGGGGSTKEKCLSCSGTGRVLSKTVAARVFRDTCNAIADGVDVAAMSNNADVNSRVGKK